MSSLDLQLRDQAIEALNCGDLIAYPSEAVWGLGCDPFNRLAVDKLLSLKSRSVDKGLILVAADLDQCKRITRHLPSELFNRLQTNCQPTAVIQRATTWLVPSNDSIPVWITGQFDTVAIRVSSHPIVAELCQAFGGMIVSTSANPQGKAAATNQHQAERYFSNRVRVYVEGDLGGQQQTSELRHLVTNEILR
jgi:L-threonylcarbamoyladenylate synthase